MPLGLEGAYGADALSQELRQRVLEQVKQRQQDFDNSLALREAGRKDLALSQGDAEFKLRLRELASKNAADQYNKDFTQGEKSAESIAPNTVFPTVDRVAPPSQAPLIGRLQMVGALQPTSGSLSSTTDVPANAATGTPPQGRLVAMPEGQLKLPTANQQNVLADNARADAALKAQTAQAEANAPLVPVGPAGILTPRSKAIGQPVHQPPTHEPNPQPQFLTGPDGKQHAIQFVNGVAKEISLPEGFGKQNATLDTRLASAKAVVQTGNDMVKALSDPKLASQLGPALGRYNTIADFVGAPPPEFAKLAGQIESYSLANMGVHGMRANTGAEAIKATLGAGRHTPATIIAIIEGLNGFANHLMENEGRSATTPSGKASAEDLIKKYSGQ